MIPADEYRLIAGRFTALADAVPGDGWDRPSPVAGWTARDVVDHLVTWFPAFLAGGTGIELPAGPAVVDDPAAAWRACSDGVQAVLDDPGSGSTVLVNPHVGEVALPDAVSRFFTADVFLHTWDLARATGQDDTLDPRRCAAMLAGMEPIEDLLRASGQYGPRVEVAADADAQTRLLAFIGRDPGWRARVDRASRLIAASPPTVYGALVDRRALEAWLPPQGMSGSVERWDPRVGGGFRMVLTYLDPAGEPGKSSSSTDVVEVGFGALDPPHRVTQLATFVADDPAYSGTMTMTWLLTATGGGTDVTVTATDVPAGIDPAVHETGIASSLANLARYVEG